MIGSNFHFMLIILGYLGVLLTGFAQLLLKKGSSKQNSKLSIYLNKFTILGYFLMLVVTLLNLYVYRYLDVKYGVIFLPFTFVVVNFLSYFILKESFSKNQLLSTLIIVIGVVVFNM
ncbi:MAG: hypothetical protein CR982_05785 [Candidatus Cloacimonadota bacterium]|nr:MAG: hypothetical protein CR982_05785 [Candidatus Cloacimonadota bacterium]PIE81368.1 MAG: hypothetical protein CSA15_00585 [Candidatus Delongbacteria bacterium]